MSGRVFHWPNMKKYTLTATTEATDHPVENVLTPFPFNTWQSTTNGDQYVTFTSATARDNSLIYIGNHNLSSFNNFRVEASNDNFLNTARTKDVILMTETRYRRDANGEPESYTYRSGYVFFATGNYEDYRVHINSTLSTYEIGFIGIYEKDDPFDVNWIQRFSAGMRTQKDIIQGNYGHNTSKLWFQRWEFELEFKDSLPKTQADMLTQELPLSETFIFQPETGGHMHLVELFNEGLPENLQEISTDSKSLSIQMIEKI